MVRPTASAVRATSSSVGLTNTPTTSTRRLTAAAISAASSSVQRRGEPGQKISPIAQAPADTAWSASSRRVRPQILIRVAADSMPTIVRTATLCGGGDPGQRAAGRLDVRRAHQGLADQHRVDPGCGQRLELGPGPIARLGDDERVVGHPPQQLERRARVDLERGQVAVVDPDDRRAESAASSSRASWTSTSTANSSSRAWRCRSASSAPGSAATISRTASAPAAAASGSLVGIDDEVLAQDRQLGHRTRVRPDPRATRRSSPPRSAPRAPRPRPARRRRPRPRAQRPRESCPAEGERRLCSAISESPGSSACADEGAPGTPLRRNRAAASARTSVLVVEHRSPGAQSRRVPRRRSRSEMVHGASSGVVATKRSSVSAAAPASIARSAARTVRQRLGPARRRRSPRPR